MPGSQQTPEISEISAVPGFLKLCRLISVNIRDISGVFSPGRSMITFLTASYIFISLPFLLHFTCLILISPTSRSESRLYLRVFRRTSSSFAISAADMDLLSSSLRILIEVSLERSRAIFLESSESCRINNFSSGFSGIFLSLGILSG